MIVKVNQGKPLVVGQCWIPAEYEPFKTPHSAMTATTIVENRPLEPYPNEREIQTPFKTQGFITECLTLRFVS